MDYKYDCFVSYNWKDEKFVEELIQLLEKNALTYFLDKTELKLYDKLDSTIKSNISQSKFLISVISQNYLNSYWCMFEALEAISQEDLKNKFLPLILKYSSNEQNFDDDFVLESIENLTNEIQVLENKMIATKAFALYGKLDKLNFIKSNLPKIYVRTQEKLYPIFELWDEDSTNKSSMALIDYIKPNKSKNISLNFSTVADTTIPKEFSSPSLSSLPEIKWSVKIGRQKWKNTPLILGDDIFIGSAGDEWNLGDEKDGVYNLSALNGRVKWFFPTNSDVNEINYFDGELIGGCDNGLVFCISAKNGNPKWKIKFDSAIMSKIYKHSMFSKDLFIIPQYNGDITFVDTQTGETLYSISTDLNIMGNIYFSNQTLFIQTVQGYVVILQEGFDKFELKKKLLIKYPDEHNLPEKLSRAELYSTPIIQNGTLVQAVCRQTYYDYPPMIAIDITSGKTKWIANNGKLKSTFGNIRTEPSIYKDLIIFLHSYSNELIAVDKNTGLLKWKIEIGRSMFQQWSSPLIFNDNIYIGRHDGYLYKVNLNTNKKEWAIYLGNEKDSGIVIDNTQIHSNEEERTVWDLYKGYPILSSPRLHRGNNLIVGTDEGFLYCIANI